MAEEKKENKTEEETEKATPEVDSDKASAEEGCGCHSEGEESGCCGDESGKDGKCGKKKKCGKKGEEELKKLSEELEQIKKQRDELQDKYLRVAAEYDNFRKRTAKEKDGIYADAYADALKQIFPIIDNLERAAACEDGNGVAEGVRLTLNQCEASLSKLGVEAIASEVGSAFDPEVHNAVMHTEDPELGEGVIASVFQKGYKKGDRVLRFAMVSVAN